MKPSDWQDWPMVGQDYMEDDESDECGITRSVPLDASGSESIEDEEDET